MARQESVERNGHEDILPYRVKGRRPLSRVHFAMPGVNQQVADDNTNRDLLVAGLLPDPVRNMGWNIDL